MKADKLFKKNTFQLSFSGAVIISFLIWLTLIFLNGKEAEQFELFFRTCYDFLADAVNVIGYSAKRNVYNNEIYTELGEKAYPPLSYMLLYPFSRIVNINDYYNADSFLMMYTEPRFLIILIIVIVVSMVALYEMAGRYLTDSAAVLKILVAGSVIISQPILFSIERGNTIIWTLFFVLFYVLFYDSSNRLLKELALISLAIAASFKLTPALLGILLIYNKDIKAAFRTVIYGLLIFLLPFLFFKGGFLNISLMLRNMAINLKDYTSEEGCTIYASLIDFGLSENETYETLCGIITKVLSLLLLATAVFHDKKWKQVLNVVMVMIVFPSHSGYYCIIYTLPAILLFLNENTHSLRDYIYLISFMIIMCDYGSTEFINYHLSIIIILILASVESVAGCAAAVRKKRAIT